MKLKYIFKFLFYTSDGNKRLSLLFPAIGVLLGSYMIFITYSIMNGLETTIEEKLSSFNYKYMINENKLNYHNNNFDKNIYDNYGFENIGLLKNDLYERSVQCAESEIDFIDRHYEILRKRKGAR